ncbi:hypothetical protein [Nonomuraea rhodomycinica]|uniref:Uncharacterized protein n=1 Tax=Nonomuraea rhodomycinica TaxID=1712872 RepID=A0A7Y6IJR5_9ACTN|nr:hypothetical protein [Nonomuraea rhodomycinica]NUW39495.1 hypothetical protein [Nonomuraea rhodomycinica]
MRIVMTESDPSGGAVAGALLTLEGHDVAYCHPPGAEASAAPCGGMAPGGRCPLADGGADLLVDVRLAPGPFTLREAGVMCALRAQVPVLVAGPPPVGTGLDEVVAGCDPGELVEACAETVTPTGSAARRAVVDAVRPLLPGAGAYPQVELVEVNGTVHVYLSFPGEIGAVLADEVRRAAAHAHTRVTHGRFTTVAHVALPART